AACRPARPAAAGLPTTEPWSPRYRRRWSAPGRAAVEPRSAARRAGDPVAVHWWSPNSCVGRPGPALACAPPPAAVPPILAKRPRRQQEGGGGPSGTAAFPIGHDLL